MWIDLLKAEVLRRCATNPEILREELSQSGVRFVVVDEIQKVPPLLDEAHWLHENEGVRFALCGSSARKLKRGQGNLLGGRHTSRAYARSRRSILESSGALLSVWSRSAAGLLTGSRSLGLRTSLMLYGEETCSDTVRPSSWARQHLAGFF